jgi:hypothetical protein
MGAAYETASVARDGVLLDRLAELPTHDLAAAGVTPH